MIVAKHDLRFRLEQALFDVESETLAVQDLDSFDDVDLDKLLEIRQNLKNATKLLSDITWIE